MSRRPIDHEEWCLDRGYEDCNCELEERQRKWDADHRQPTASDIPTARVVRKAKP